MQRILYLLPVLLIVCTAVFFVNHLIPGDPARVMLGDQASEESIKQLRQQMGLDLPIYQQYYIWIIGLLKGDLGYSYFLHQPVTQAILEHLGPTLALAILAQVLILLISIPIGVLSATRKGTFADQSFMMSTLLGISVPHFLLGMFFIFIVSLKLGWLPVSGYQPLSADLWEFLKYLILPAFTIAIPSAALIARMTRSSMIDVLNMDFIKTARSKGLKEFTVIFRHALRNAFLPILTVIGLSLGGLVTGAIVTETIFAIPGMGQMVIHAILNRDFPLVQGTVIFVTVNYVVVNLIVDLLYAAIDPRVRLRKVG